MHREGTAGVSSREDIMEVAFEQWTERNGSYGVTSRLQRFPALQGDGIGQRQVLRNEPEAVPYRQSAESFL